MTRHDAVLQRIFGFARMANFKATMRLFLRFTPGSNEGVMDHLYRWLFGNIAIDGLTLDLDSTVMTRYGCQQGAAKGYNPAKRGHSQQCARLLGQHLAPFGGQKSGPGARRQRLWRQRFP